MYPIVSPKAPKPNGPYSQGASAGRHVWVSAQLPLDPETNELVGTSAAEKTQRCLLNIDGVLNSLNMGLEDVAKLGIYLTSLEDLEEVDRVLGERIPRPFPARTVLEVKALEMSSTIAIDCEAVR